MNLGILCISMILSFLLASCTTVHSQVIQNSDFEDGLNSWNASWRSYGSFSGPSAPWCNFKNISCNVSGLIIGFSNETVSGKKSLVLGHPAGAIKTGAEIIVSQDITIPASQGIISLNTKTVSPNEVTQFQWGVYIKYYKDGELIIAYQTGDDWPQNEFKKYENWTQINLSIDGRMSQLGLGPGTNLHIIFEFNSFYQHDSDYTGDVMWYIDDIKFVPKQPEKPIVQPEKPLIDNQSITLILVFILLIGVFLLNMVFHKHIHKKNRKKQPKSKRLFK